MARLDAKWYDFWGRGQEWYHFWQDSGGGPQSLDRSAADAVSTADAADGARALSRTTDEGGFQSDAFQADAFQVGGGISTADAATIQRDLVRSTTEAISTSDAATANVGDRHASDSIATTDAATAQVDLLRSADDAISTSDAATALGPETAFQADAFQTDAFQIFASGINVSATDAPSTSDAATRTGQFYRSAAEGIATVDAATIPVSGGERFIIVVIG